MTKEELILRSAATKDHQTEDAALRVAAWPFDARRRVP